MVKSSGIRHIKMFSKNKQTNAVVFLMPALVIYVWEGFIRRNILSEIIKMVIPKERQLMNILPDIILVIKYSLTGHG